MTGKIVHGSADAIWDDGEWISWDWINQQIDDEDFVVEDAGDYSEHFSGDVVPVGLEETFNKLVHCASEYRRLTGRYLQIWGELGELYAEVKWGIKRHVRHAQGSDGRLGNDLVEVKTISPEKGSDTVQVKRSGNFNKLLIVKIGERFSFESKMIDRKLLTRGNAGHLKGAWNTPSK